MHLILTLPWAQHFYVKTGKCIPGVMWKTVLFHRLFVQNGLLSVTVTGPSSAICDALCTAVFVLGPEEGSAFLERYNEEHESSYAARFLEKE